MSTLSHFAAPALTGLAALPLFAWAGTLYGLGAIILAVVGMIQSRKNLTEIQLLSQQLRDLEQQLAYRQKWSNVDELSAGIAHEINNPLGIIAQEAQWIRHIFAGENVCELRETLDCQDSLREINRQVDRCKEVVHKLLSLAREMEPVIQAADVNHLVEEMAQIVKRGRANDKAVSIDLQLQPDLPFVQTDPPLLRQVILNLLINGVQAIDKEGNVTVVTRRAADYAEITVRDTGQGISKENLERIFSPFFSTKRHGEGSGLGLAICRGIIERLGGYISVGGAVGKGAAFTVHLPLTRPQQGDGKQ